MGFSGDRYDRTQLGLACPALLCDAPDFMCPATAHVVLEDLRARRDEILSCAAQHGAHDVRVFGSIARGEAVDESDIDLLVRMESGRSLLDLVGLWQELEDLLGARVDVLSEGGVSPLLRERIFADAVVL